MCSHPTEEDPLLTDSVPTPGEPGGLQGTSPMMGKQLGTIRATFVVSVCCMGSFLFAYDTGIIGGILTLSSFQHDFRYTTSQSTSVNSNAVSVLQAGAFFGCFFIWPIAARLGRKASLLIAAFVFELGAILQVINTHSLPCFYVGRVISGLGVGAATVLIPIYAAEMSPREIRGRLGSFFQLFFAAGVMVSYGVTYAVSTHVKSSSRQWQIPIGLQFVPAGLLGIGVLFIKESPRWLAKQGRGEEALCNLIWVRGGDDSPQVQAEFAEITAGLEQKLRASQGFTYKELLLPSNRLRIFIAITVQLCQQLTGNTSLAYYAPQVFKSVGAGNANMFITLFFGVVKFVSCFFFQWLLVTRIGRKTAFMGGAAAMGSLFLIIACLVATHPPDPKAASISPSGAAAIAMVYLEAAAYNLSWAPLAWVFIGEIFSTRTREVGVATGAASQWLFNFMMSQITPYAINNIGWRTFLMFGIFNYAIIAYSWFLLRETAGKSLEEMEEVFGSKATAIDSEEVRAQALAVAPGDESPLDAGEVIKATVKS